MKHRASELIDLIKDLKEALEFYEQECDFGPAYGLAIARRDDAIKRAKKAIKDKDDYLFLEERFEYITQRTPSIRANLDAVFKMEHPLGYRERLPPELMSAWHQIYGDFCLLSGVIEYALPDKKKA